MHDPLPHPFAPPSGDSAGSQRRRLGLLYGVASAATFGVTAPLAKLLLGTTSPLALAGLLYGGGGLGLTLASLLRRSTDREARLRLADAPWLLGAIALGGIAGPVLMLVGFERTSGISGALLLNLEVPLTVLVATWFFREHLGRRGLVAVALIVAGAMVLARPTSDGKTDMLGALCVLGACLCWGIENNLMQRLSARDPWAVARTKMLAASAFNLLLASMTERGLPEPRSIGFALAAGAVGYGASNVLVLRAMRELGAARQAALFATAPFLGAVAAIPILGEWPGTLTGVAAALMAAGVALMAVERHHHRHQHEALAHDHAHSHDDPHHDHVHEPSFTGSHAHPHQHQALAHEHEHLPDAHHRHLHEDEPS
ncbi:MAG: DMT family transporter [Deltaproteobacteria bacterium]|nr:DMT family transporter [Deltaproteobacteria bacterium]